MFTFDFQLHHGKKVNTKEKAHQSVTTTSKERKSTTTNISKNSCKSNHSSSVRPNFSMSVLKKKKKINDLRFSIN